MSQRLRWAKSSPHSVRAVGAPFAVSRARVLEMATGELVERFSAWRGEALEVGRRDIPMPELLGVYPQAELAKARCDEVAAREGP